MAEIETSTLIDKLTDLAHKALNDALANCRRRGNPHLELVHWLFAIFQLPDSDFKRVLESLGLERARVHRDMIQTLDQLPRGSTSTPAYSEQLDSAMLWGWTYASLLFRSPRISTGHLLIGLLRNGELRRLLLEISKEFSQLKVEALADDFSRIVKGSPEESATSMGGEPALVGEAAPVSGEPGQQEALNRFSVDLTEKARKGEIDPVVGRRQEVSQIVDILRRRRQNNPILTGEAGVGKTAVVEGFALSIARGEVDPSLRNVSIKALDLGLLQAGAGVKGEFENRIRQIIAEVQASPKPIILFIDEAHMLVGAGGAPGQADAANLLKPALARGTLRTIAATTWGEYKRYFEKDPALSRRFQVVKVEEPSEQKALLMVRGLASVLKRHHGVEIFDEAFEAAVRLGHRYIPDRQLPDKAVSLLDTACARVAVSQGCLDAKQGEAQIPRARGRGGRKKEPAEAKDAPPEVKPPQIDDCDRRIQALELELEILNRETTLGFEHEKRRAELVAQLQKDNQEREQLAVRLQKEQALVRQIFQLRQTLLSLPEKPAKDGQRAELQEKLRQANQELAECQGHSPLIFPTVDAQAIASVVADWTGIPVGRMLKDEIDALLNLADILEKRIVGQRHALDAIARQMQGARANTADPRKPRALFLLAGPTGVGKTETALALAETLYGGESNLLTFNMTEFTESHTVSTLKGSPPGYVSTEEGGVLTEAVRRHPYSVILLDEFEKAHLEVQKLFYQVFDRGMLEDAHGREVDFKNTVIMLTTNLGGELIIDLCKEARSKVDPEELAKALRKALQNDLPPAFFERIRVILPYYPLNEEMLRSIIRLQLARIAQRLRENSDLVLSYADSVVEQIAGSCTELARGARMVEACISQTILPEISRTILARMREGKALSSIALGLENGAFTYAFE